MKNILLTIGITLGLVLIVSAFGEKNLGASIIGSQVPTQGVWAVASTSQPWTALEVSGSLANAAVNSSTTVGTTAVQVLAPNSGRVKASVCNNSSIPGFLTLNSSVTTTPGAANYFVAGTGQIVPAGSCINL